MTFITFKIVQSLGRWAQDDPAASRCQSSSTFPFGEGEKIGAGGISGWMKNVGLASELGWKDGRAERA